MVFSASFQAFPSSFIPLAVSCSAPEGGKGGKDGLDLDVSKNRGTPKWMVYNVENPIKMDDLEVPLFLETPICSHFF